MSLPSANPAALAAATAPTAAAELAARWQAHFGNLLSAPTEFRGELTLELADAEAVPTVCAFAKAELGFD